MDSMMRRDGPASRPGWPAKLGWGLLWAAFFAFGLYVRHRFPGDAGVGMFDSRFGWDYTDYLRFFSDPGSVAAFRFRHPLLGLILSPAVFIGWALRKHSEPVYRLFLSVFFSAVVTAAAWVNGRTLRKAVGLSAGQAFVALSVFLSFGYLWLLAVVPESFSVSLLLLSVAVHYGMSAGRPLSRRSLAGWAGLALLTGGATVTNGVKVVLAFIATHRPTRRHWKWIGILSAGVLVFGAAAYYARMAIHNLSHPEALQSVPELFLGLLDWIPHGVPLLRRLAIVGGGFFAEPLMLHGALAGEGRIPLAYGSPFPAALVWCVYLPALVSAVVNRRHLLVRIFLAFFSVDVLIHIVFFWNGMEGRLFCGHWFFFLPLLLGLLFRNLPPVWARAYAAGLSAVALLMFCWNARMFFL